MLSVTVRSIVAIGAKIAVYLKRLKCLQFHAGHESEEKSLYESPNAVYSAQNTEAALDFPNCVQGIGKGQVEQGDFN